MEEGSVDYRCELLSKTLTDVVEMLKDVPSMPEEVQENLSVKDYRKFLDKCIEYAKIFKRT